MSELVRLDPERTPKLRLAHGLSQVELAKAIGITQATASRAERGFPTTFQTAEKIAKVLGVEVGWLFEKMPGDVRRDPDDLRLAWMDFIEGKTRELKDAVANSTSPEDFPMNKVVEIENLHRDIEKYAGQRLELEKGDSRISLALDEMRFAVEEAYKVRFLGSRMDPEAVIAAAIAEEEEVARKTA